VFAANQFLFALLAGLAAGGIHVLSGPDHLAAIAPLSLGRKVRTWMIGARWGLGHASGVLFVGLLSLLIREIIPLESFLSWAERLVGVALIGIGLWGLRKAFSTHLHAHEHSHGAEKHVHIHAHAQGHSHDHPQTTTHSHTHAAFAVGTLHGVAGSSHVLGILPALAFPTQLQAVTYLVAYGVGTILAMSAFSTMIAFVSSRRALATAVPDRWLMVGCSSFAVGLGAYWLAAVVR